MDVNNNFLKSISPKSLFLYGVIVCIFIFFFKHSQISFSVTIGIIFALTTIFFLYKNEKASLENSEVLHETKSNNITPKTKKIQNYVDLTDFIFSIQEFYDYNPQAFIELVTATDTFLEVYESVMSDNSLAGDLYEIAEGQKLLALNSLQSIIIIIPDSKKVIKKLNTAQEIFEQLLNKYLTKINTKNKKYVNENGFHNNTKLIELNISPYNKYCSDDINKNEQYFKFY